MSVIWRQDFRVQSLEVALVIRPVRRLRASCLDCTSGEIRSVVAAVGFRVHGRVDPVSNAGRGGLVGRRVRLRITFGGRPLVAGYLVDPASSHMLVSKIKPCMSKYKRLVL